MSYIRISAPCCPDKNHFRHQVPVINAAYSSCGAAARALLMLKQFPWQPLAATSLLPHGVGGLGPLPASPLSLSEGPGWLSSLGLRGNLTQQQQAVCVCWLDGET